MKKKIKIIAGIICVILVIIALWLYSTISVIYKEFAPNETLLKGEDHKQALIIYQPSKHDGTKQVTDTLAKQLNKHGYTVTINYPSNKLTYNPNDYDIIAYGSPVYVSNVSDVLKDYITSLSLNNKHIFIYAVGLLENETLELDTMISWVNESNTIASIKISKSNTKDFIDIIESTLIEWKLD